MRAYPANAKNNRPAACSTPPRAVVTRSSRTPSTSPDPSTITTTAASTASTIATMTRVTSADFWMPA